MNQALPKSGFRALISACIFSALVCSSGPAGPSATSARWLPEPNAAAGPMSIVHTPGHSFYIDRYEMSELAPDDYFAVPGQIPVLGVSPADAQAICKRHQKRLCSVDEWRNACLGVQRRRFSYANTYDPVVCNTGAGRPEPAGASIACHSDSYVHDLSGNVMEWADAGDDHRAVALGGSFSSGRDADCFSQQYFPVNSRSDQIGFRCCRDATGTEASEGLPQHARSGGRL